MRRLTRLILVLVVLTWCTSCCVGAPFQSTTTKPLASVSRQTVAVTTGDDGADSPKSISAPSSCVNVGDTAWMLVSTLLVLGMVPALAFFEAGMLRSKNTLSLVTQMFSGIVILSVMWVVFGYSLTYGPSQGGVIGSLESALWISNVEYDECNRFAPTIPAACFALFEMMFAAITPLLTTGAFAERMKFKAFLTFVILWEIFVYYPVAHWLWGGGFLSSYVFDFAGGIVIHTTAGVASLVMAIWLGPRLEFDSFAGDFPPSNLPLAAIGAALLWMGWFGFNGGSAFEASSVAVSALVSTQVACSISACVWLALSSYHTQGQPTATAVLNGAIAGLAGITPASGYINTPATIVVALILGVASYYGSHVLKRRFRVDDALDVSMVHGVTGVIGSLSVGVFATTSANPTGPTGAWYGNPTQLAYQLGGVSLALMWSLFVTVVLLFALERVFVGGVRVGEEDEEIGLDYAEHGEVAYHNLHVLDDQINHTHLNNDEQQLQQQNRNGGAEGVVGDDGGVGSITTALKMAASSSSNNTRSILFAPAATGADSSSPSQHQPSPASASPDYVRLTDQPVKRTQSRSRLPRNKEYRRVDNSGGNSGYVLVSQPSPSPTSSSSSSSSRTAIGEATANRDINLG